MSAGRIRERILAVQVLQHAALPRQNYFPEGFDTALAVGPWEGIPRREPTMCREKHVWVPSFLCLFPSTGLADPWDYGEVGPFEMPIIVLQAVLSDPLTWCESHHIEIVGDYDPILREKPYFGNREDGEETMPFQSGASKATSPHHRR
jgi:hypothetical protein